MTTELRTRNPAQQIYIAAMTAAYRSNLQLHDPSVWQVREPELEEMMLRDADVMHAVTHRRHLIAGRQWTLTPQDDEDPAAKLAVKVGTELLKGIKHFTGARLNLARAFFSGSRYSFIHGQPRMLTLGDGKPRTWWVPTRLEDRDKRMYRIVPKVSDDMKSGSAHWERWNVWAGEWQTVTRPESIQTIRHVYMDDEGTLGYGRGLRESLGWWWYAKTHVFAESLQAVERFAQGILHAKVQGIRASDTSLPNDELITKWRDVLEDLRSRHVLVSDKDDDVEMVQMNAAGWEILSKIREELKATIYTLVLGSNLPTGASEGGSYALADVQADSTEALIQFDRETLEETLTDDLLGCVWWHNYPNLVELGVAEQKPRFNIRQEKKLDPKERADIAAVLNGMGVALSREDVFEQTGFKIPEEGEPIIEPQAPPQQLGLPGFDTPPPPMR